MQIEKTPHGYIVHGYDDDALPWFKTRDEAVRFVAMHSMEPGR